MQWQTVFKIKWPMPTIIKVVACLSNSNISNSAQQCQDMELSSNNSEACLNKINSKPGLIKIKDMAEANLINNHR